MAKDGVYVYMRDWMKIYNIRVSEIRISLSRSHAAITFFSFSHLIHAPLPVLYGPYEQEKAFAHMGL